MGEVVLDGFFELGLAVVDRAGASSYWFSAVGRFRLPAGRFEAFSRFRYAGAF